ncbi:CoaE-domain-containing protein [Phlyctochytrium arcticum]|nr:CoaE-domain-containing protein [Phlyctochytrium arcticum]
MLILGLTGGIATGKSTVSTYLAAHPAHPIPIVDADLIAKDVVRPSHPAYYRVLAAFGPSVLSSDGTIDRPKLGSIVFSNQEKRQQLNAATHPVIRVEMLRQVLEAFLKGERVCVLDTPLLFEAGLHRFVHKVVVVYCPESIQRTRLVARDNLSDEQASSRITSQMSIEEKRKRAEMVLDNSGDQQTTERQHWLDQRTTMSWPIFLLTGPTTIVSGPASGAFPLAWFSAARTDAETDHPADFDAWWW